MRADKMDPIVLDVVIRPKIKMGFWDAIKLRLMGREFREAAVRKIEEAQKAVEF